MQRGDFDSAGNEQYADLACDAVEAIQDAVKAFPFKFGPAQNLSVASPSSAAIKTEASSASPQAQKRKTSSNAQPPTTRPHRGSMAESPDSDELKITVRISRRFSCIYTVRKDTTMIQLAGDIAAFEKVSLKILKFTTFKRGFFFRASQEGVGWYETIGEVSLSTVDLFWQPYR